MTRSTFRPRGFSLVEALIALAVTSGGLLVMVGAQGTLRQGAEAARHRGEALRLAQAQIEQARAFAALPAWDALASQPEQAASGAGAQARYRLEPQVGTDTALPLKAMSVRVRWPGAAIAGDSQSLQLTSLVAAASPALSGSLLLPRQGLPLARPLGRHPGIPLTAQDLGNGRSAFVPTPGQAWVLDNASGRITGQCSVAVQAPVLSADALAACSQNTQALLLAGHVRFAGTLPDAQQPDGPALNLDLALDAPGAQCVDDAPASAAAAAVQTLVRYHCLVPVAAGAGWAGTSRVVPQPFAGDNAGPWTLAGNGPQGHRLCRYTPTPQATDNASHPERYTAVTTPLLHQNFLVVAAAQACPAGTAPHPA